MRQKTKVAVAAMEDVQSAIEITASRVINFLRTTSEPTAEAAHEIIDTMLAEYDCISPEGRIVASGKQAVEPHEHGAGAIERNVPIVIDIYPQSQKTGYFADMTRTVCLGTPAPAVQSMYDTVLAAQELAIAMVEPGVPCMDIHIAVRDYFQQQGYETRGQGAVFPYAEGFVHALGHGVGKQVHEAPRISEQSVDVLQVGDVITIEPGLYYQEFGAVRIEDMLLVTDTGAKNLTTFTKTFCL